MVTIQLSFITYHLEEMRNYQKITQNAEGQLLAWYWSVDHSGNVEMDFDVLNDYTIYPHETGAFIAEYLPTGLAYWSYATADDACKAVLNKVNEKKKLQANLEEAGAKFQEVVKANSLDNRYKNVVVEKKPKTNDQLREKYAVARMNTTARLNRAYYSRLLDH